jgi:hypothetical protein
MMATVRAFRPKRERFLRSCPKVSGTIAVMSNIRQNKDAANLFIISESSGLGFCTDCITGERNTNHRCAIAIPPELRFERIQKALVITRSSPIDELALQAQVNSFQGSVYRFHAN